VDWKLSHVTNAIQWKERHGVWEVLFAFLVTGCLRSGEMPGATSQLTHSSGLSCCVDDSPDCHHGTSSCPAADTCFFWAYTLFIYSDFFWEQPDNCLDSACDREL